MRIKGVFQPTPDPMDPGVWVEEVLAPGWLVRCRMVVQGGSVVIAELRIKTSRKATPPGGVNHEVMRRIPYGRFGPYVLAWDSFAQHAGPGSIDQALFHPMLRKMLPKLNVISERPRPRRARGRDDRFYAEVARDYLSAIERGSRTPIKDLAAQRSESSAKVRDWVHEARERALLSAGTKGEIGGRLTSRADHLLSAPSAPLRTGKRKQR